ncbi:tRNA lysidine(34) synthetase TilS [Chryseobacterium indoltheticum]|uniref:tRNA(Ile)-lysidine synthase n=1 Tax=Chryseobacterium indoltheticum TaxID=254 RepID=A0A381JTH4_9FLAO|nr:tRNA lysidine(34) synthetase TilS [Chryseobacterium indoltheticum]AZA75710.1 tRNA lysidine(34) synthetase TilS [Chryseobacterium indoltheticum]SIQ48393.1 tRNA(Ile)-lysidine synthase [Chryseobacterium indoltheticum]SUY53844.1 tRNA(Ile)-lysidine synthase [Chryseobacterium indoltheticum]
MLTQSAFEKQLQNLIRLSDNPTYLLAVSGGADSIVLAYLFSELRNAEIKFQIAHINYKLRGEDSDSDQKVVEDFCKKNDIKFHLYEVSENDKQPENSIQLWARELRYRFFREIQAKENLDFLVTAHHLNDQLETFIINLSKASGINGLSGIPANENNILRPLLNFSKDEIYQFAKENNIVFREDLSNKKNDYLRNKIRNEIVPKLSETNGQFLENFKKSISHLNQTKNFVHKQIEIIEKDLSVFNKEHKILSKEKLAQESDFVQFEILKKYGFKRTEEIQKIFSAENGSSFFSEDYHLTVDREGLILKLKNLSQEIDPEIILLENFDSHQDQIMIDLKSYIDENQSFNWVFDTDKLHFPLYLRKQKNGDEFYPSGFSGKKKVSKFFRDEKLSALAKEKIWVLCDTEDQILGIVPLRQDRRFEAEVNTQKTTTVQWTEEQPIL